MLMYMWNPIMLYSVVGFSFIRLEKVSTITIMMIK
jgi:hypothetical protein